MRNTNFTASKYVGSTAMTKYLNFDAQIKAYIVQFYGKVHLALRPSTVNISVLLFFF